MIFHERPGAWQTTFSNPPIEINLGGDAAAPLPANAEMAHTCETQLEALLSQAVAYIAEHIAQAAAIVGIPEIEWIDFGLSNFGAHREFELFFSDGATYVLWAVRFVFQTDPQTHATRFFPVGFSRSSW